MGGVRLLVGLGQHLARRHLPVLALPFEVVRFPDLGNHGQGLLPHFPCFAWVDAHAQLFIGSGPASPELDAPVGQVVHHCHPFGDPDGVMVGQDHDAESQPNSLGEPRKGAENDLGARGLGERGQKVVFDEPHRVEPHLVGQYALFQCFLDDSVVVQHGTLHLVSQRKLHYKPSSLRLSVAGNSTGVASGGQPEPNK